MEIGTSVAVEVDLFFTETAFLIIGKAKIRQYVIKPDSLLRAKSVIQVRVNRPISS